MKNSTPMFPGFHLQTLRRKPRSEAQKLADKLALLQRKSIKQVGEVFDKRTIQHMAVTSFWHPGAEFRGHHT